MSRIMEEPKQHIHDKLEKELNEMSIRIKLHHLIVANSAEEADRLRVAREHKPEPTWEEVQDLVWRCLMEMQQCTKPFKVHR